MDSIIDLHAPGRTATSLLPYDAMDLKSGWHRRARVVYGAPPEILATYLPLASGTFVKQYRGDAVEKGESTITAVGDVGLGLALDENRTAVVSVECIALQQLIQETEGTPEATPEWLTRLASTWTSNQVLFMHNSSTGWRGIFAEHRLWSSLLLSENASVKTPHSKPTVRAWAPSPILDDMKACVGKETIAEVAQTIAEMNFDGAPDLVLYRNDQLWFVEVKSSTDHLRQSQVEMLTRLKRIGKVTCSICCPNAARKRMAATMEAFTESSDEEE
jgi:hypothetical protein